MIEFKNLKITTMTLVFQMNGKMNNKSIFHLLPITKVLLSKNRVVQKCILPVSDKPGSVLSIRAKLNGQNLVRGIIENNKKRFFKNSVTLKMSTSIKNVSLKISPKTIQLCGASSKADGISAINYIVNHLTHIRNMMDLIQNNPYEYNICVKWIEEHLKGDVVDRTWIEQKNINQFKLFIQRSTKDFNLRQKPIVIPSLYHHDMMTYLLSLMDDQIYFSHYMDKIKNIHRLQTVFEDEISINKVNEVMVNYNYNLGFRINRDELDRLINGRNGLCSYYDNALSNSVTIELPYNQPLDYMAKKIKKKIPHHTFLVYKSGAVTQSGPCSASQGGKCASMMEDAFNIFIGTIHEIKDQIML
ncbi:MAG TPA: hypothetical protein VLG50_07240 [Candidatus Saccharimonadales bacterium]|nr:hypothetical protein [Candidatus Saccharimonadales bacterium]